MNREEQIVAALWTLREVAHPITRAAVRVQVMGAVEKGTATQDLPASWDVAFQRTVRTLVAAGVLIRKGSGDIAWPKEPPQAQPELPNIPPNLGDGGDRGRPPSGGDRGNDGDNGGGGFRAILAHPYLFALPHGEFEQLLDSI